MTHRVLDREIPDVKMSREVYSMHDNIDFYRQTAILLPAIYLSECY